MRFYFSMALRQGLAVNSKPVRDLSSPDLHVLGLNVYTVTPG